MRDNFYFGRGKGSYSVAGKSILKMIGLVLLNAGTLKLSIQSINVKSIRRRATVAVSARNMVRLRNVKAWDRQTDRPADRRTCNMVRSRL